METFKSNQENTQNSDVENSSELIKNLYKKGRVFILSTVLSLGLLKSIPDKELSFQKTLIEKFDFSEEKEKEIVTTLNTIFTEEEANEYIENNKNITNFLLNFPEEVIKLDDLYDVTPAILGQIDQQNVEDELAKTLKDEKYLKVLEDIRGYFPEDYKPKADFLPLSEMKRLDNLEYVEGLKVLAELKMTGNSEGFHKDISQISKNPKVYELLQKLSSLDAHLSFEIFFYIPAETYKYEAGSPYEETLKELTDFINDGTNNDIFKYIDGAPIGHNEMYNIVSDTSGYWKNFYENPDNQSNIQILKDHGYTFNSFLSLGSEYMDHIQDDFFVEALVALSAKVSKATISSRLSRVFRQLEPYYDFKNTQGFIAFSDDLEKIDKISDIGNIDREVVSSRKDVNKNIFQALSQETYESQKLPYNFLQDPALKVVYELGYEDTVKIPEFLKGMPIRDKAEWIMRVSRNMNVRGLEITAANFEKVFYESVEMRLNPGVVDQDLFTNRNVAYFAHNERWQGGQKRFGKDSTVVGLQRQKPKELSIFQADSTITSLFETKKKFLEYISSHSNLTILVDAHGSEFGFFMTEGIPATNGKVSMEYKDRYVSFQELASAFEKRYDAGHKDIPIFLEDACFNQNFIRNLYGELMRINKEKRKTISLPVSAGVSEYGQYGFSEGGDYGNVFLETLLSTKKSTKIKDIITLEASGLSSGINSNISIFVPYKEKQPVNNKQQKNKKQSTYYQIAKNEQKPIDKIFDDLYVDGLEKNMYDGTTASYFEAAQPNKAKELKEKFKQRLG
jgi:hypothetical protein